jgi:2-C-methyl-D-erythritol 4-phosphate cytidylyltransferase
MPTVALVLAAGRGERLGHLLPKGFVPLAGRPLLWHALAAMEAVAEIDRVLAVIPADALERYRDAISSAPELRKLAGPVVGGKERQDSVRAGLAALPPGTTIVAVHDAARPCVRPDAVRRVIAAARADGAAILAAPVRDTIKRVVAGLVVETPLRAECWAAQTPQVFRRDWLERGHREATEVATDDAALVEWLGHPVRLSLGGAANFKITTPADLELAESWLAHRTAASAGAAVTASATPVASAASASASTAPAKAGQA